MPDFTNHVEFKNHNEYMLTYTLFAILVSLSVINQLGNGWNGYKYSICTTPEE